MSVTTLLDCLAAGRKSFSPFCPTNPLAALFPPAELLPHWLEVRWTAAKAAAVAAAEAAWGAVTRAAAATANRLAHTASGAASYVRGVWEGHAAPALDAARRSVAVTANRAQAAAKAWWLHTCVPALQHVESWLERQLGGGWPRIKQAAARVAHSAQGVAQRGHAAVTNAAQQGWEAAQRSYVAAQRTLEEALLQQLARVPALQPYARRPAVTYLLYGLVAVVLAPVLVALLMPRRPAPRQAPPPRRFVAKAGGAAPAKPAAAMPAKPLAVAPVAAEASAAEEVSASDSE